MAPKRPGAGSPLGASGAGKRSRSSLGSAASCDSDTEDEVSPAFAGSVVPASTGATSFSPWEPADSVFVRFPGLTGIKLTRKVYDVYRGQPGTIHVDFFNSAGERILFRHPKNTGRSSVDSRAKLKAALLEDGLMQDYRSKFFCTNEDDNRFYFIAGATIIESAYEAWETDRGNDNIKETFKSGIRDVILIDKRCPDDVLEYLKKSLNKFNKMGNDTTWLENLIDVDVIENSWLKYRKEEQAEQGEADEQEDNGEGGVKRKRSQAGYESDYSKFLKLTYPALNMSFQIFDKCKITKHTLEKVGLWKALESYAYEACVFSDPRLDSKSIIKVFHEIFSIFKRHQREAYVDVIFGLLKLSLPTSDTTPWLLTTPQTVKEKLPVLFIKLKETKTFRVSAMPKKLAQVHSDRKPNTPDAGCKARLKPKKKPNNEMRRRLGQDRTRDVQL